jgi:MoxR-like ATPase
MPVHEPVPDRPFRIIYVDDALYDSVQSGKSPDVAGKGYVLKQLREMAGREDCIELVLGRGLEFGDRDPALRLQGDKEKKDDWSADTIKLTNILLLDLAGLRRLRRPFRVEKEQIRNIEVLPDDPDDEDIQWLNNELSGAGFLLGNRRSILERCRRVILMTRFDTRSGFEGDLVEKYIYPVCTDASSRGTPNAENTWAIMGNLHDNRGLDRIVDEIKSIYRDFTEGFTRPTDRDAIELAAVHDRPVLIVGETGTGKELVTESIHRRWEQVKTRRKEEEEDEKEERKRLPGEENSDTSPFQVFNCAGLNPELAASELFGIVAGTASSVELHRLGAVPIAAGLRLNPSGSKSSPDNYRDKLLDQNEILELDDNGNGAGYDLKVVYEHSLEKKPEGRDEPIEVANTKNRMRWGTLFLDEFGELPPSTQAQLLRFLQSQEVRPQGYPGRIKGLQVRIIAATNDPRVAALAGENLRDDMPSGNEDHVFRGDLVSRLKGQVIKTTEVNQKNVEDWVRHFSETTSEVPWTENAKDYFVEVLSEHIEKLDDLHSGDQREREIPFFANRREIQQVVELADTYVSTAQHRGLRDIGDEVTPAVIDRVWNPSSVLLPQIRQMGMGTPTSPEANGSKEEEDTEFLHRQVRELYEMIKDYLRRKGHPIEDWRLPDSPDQIGEKGAYNAGTDLRDHVKSLKETEPGVVNSLWERITEKYDDPTVRKAAFGRSRSAISKWFN